MTTKVPADAYAASDAYASAPGYETHGHNHDNSATTGYPGMTTKVPAGQATSDTPSSASSAGMTTQQKMPWHGGAVARWRYSAGAVRGRRSSPSKYGRRSRRSRRSRASKYGRRSR